MRFYIQRDSGNQERAYKQSIHYELYKKINIAIIELKKKKNPHRLCFRDVVTNTVGTLMLFEGTRGAGIFSSKKLDNLIQVGPRMFVPKTLVRKTTRKRKIKCKKSKRVTTIGHSTKSTPLDFSSHL